ncbi:MAG: Sir2 family NAD-dependent protein deacetylase [Candidatus Omnitrophica bacterium]|nr:Sir2 family NAD-dependent protein deacetylase [Candidatus Omnitrophota bacterium]
MRDSTRILVFTGAGISTESGISDYRSKGGLWQRFQPVTIQEFCSSKVKRREYWETKKELYQALETAQPNSGHFAIVELEKLRKLKGLITQNIDGLHTMAGIFPEKIIELHGNNRETICLSCQNITGWQETYHRLRQEEDDLCCHLCGGLLKPNTISFGQSLEQNKLDLALRWSRDCDLVLAVGSTLIVEPAASIPRIAKSTGAKLVIITNSETPLDHIADLKITESAGGALEQAISVLTTKEQVL